MGTVLVFIGVLVVSQLAAMAAGLSLAIHFGAQEEFIAVIMAIILFSIVTLVVFAIAYVLARAGRVFQIVAVSLAVLAIGLVALPGAIQWIANPSAFTAGRDDIPIVLQILLPAWTLILVQWGMVRRRWLRMHEQESLSRWPWIATVVAGLVVFNPGGLEAASSALRGPAGNRTPAIVGALVLLLFGLAEAEIRRRVLRRRLTSSSPLPQGANP